MCLFVGYKLYENGGLLLNIWFSLKSLIIYVYTEHLSTTASTNFVNYII